MLPYRGLEIRGVAEVVDLPYGATIRRIGRRYIGPQADGFGPRTTTAASSCASLPETLRAWDFADDYPAS